MQEYRNDPRVQEDADVIVKIQSSPGAHELEGRVIPCHSTDVSTSGMQLSVETDAPVGTLLELEIMFSQTQHKFRHMGNVVWNREAKNDSRFNDRNRHIGIRFDTASNPQFQSWRSQVADLLRNNATA